MWKSGVVVTVFICSYWAPTTHGLPDYGEMKFFEAPMSFTAESTVLLNDISRRDKEVSYKLNSTLLLLPLPARAPEPRLVKFTLLHPYLLGRGTHVNAEYMPIPSLWDSHATSDFYAYNNNGTFNEIYVDPSEPEELINFKRSLLSLFQFSFTLDLGNETDFSGTCEVQYEVMSEQIIRKVKRRCSGEAEGARRVARYTHDARGPREVYAEEVHELHGALKARAWLQLRRTPSPAAAPAPAAAVPAALAPLPLAAPALELEENERPSVEELEKLLSEAGRLTGAEADAGAGAEADAGTVAAALRLLPALRAAAPAALAALLDRAAAAGTLAGACGALGAAGSAAALAAVRARADAHLAARYYDGLALAHRPDEEAVLAALGAGEEGGAGGAALLAAGAAGARLAPAGAADVRARLQQALELCQEEECASVVLGALGNMRHADDTELLLQHAAGGGAAARAALAALASGPAPALYNATRLRRLERAALGRGALPERAAALELLLARGARASSSLLPLLLALPRHAPPELLSLAWGRAAALAERDAGLRALLAALPARDGGWAVRARAGRSVAVERGAGGGGGWRTALRASLLERDGTLRRAELTLAATAPDDTTDDVVTLEVRQPKAPGVMELLPTVDGAVLRARPLHPDRTALSVLRLTRDERGARAVLGGGVLQWRRRAMRAGALRARPGGRLAVRGAAAAQVEARVAGSWGELSASALRWVTPRASLQLVAGGCSRADVAPLEVVTEVRLRSALGAARRRVLRVRGLRLPSPGRSLPLADPLRAACT